jgi:antitoxin (DNA-binding transcriptional repressor) of toxin-antitoxin stability system
LLWKLAPQRQKTAFLSRSGWLRSGEQVVITRHGRPVAQLAPPPPERRKARFDGMKGRIRLLPGWDDPITEEELLGEAD